MELKVTTENNPRKSSCTVTLEFSWKEAMSMDVSNRSWFKERLSNDKPISEKLSALAYMAKTIEKEEK